MGEQIAFYTLATLILAFGILVITAREVVHSVLYLVMDFLCVAALYVLLGAEFLAVIQVLVYAGGIVVLYLFVVMLVNLKRPAEVHRDPRRQTKLGIGLAVAVLAELVAIVTYSYSTPAPVIAAATEAAGAAGGTTAAGLAGGASTPALAGNTAQVGWMLYTHYLIPFEIASMLLLVAMIGAILLAKKEL